MIHLLRVEVTGVDWSNLTAQEDWALLGATSVWQKQQKTCPTGWKYLWSCGAAHRAGNADGKALGCREPSHSVPQPRLCCTWMLPPRMAGSPQVPHGPAAPLGAAHHPAAPAGGWGLGCGMGVQLHGGVRQEDGARISLGCWAAGSEAKGRRWQQNIPPEHEENSVGGWGLEQAAWRGGGVSFSSGTQNPCGHNPDQCPWGDLVEQGGWSHLNPSVSLFAPLVPPKLFFLPSSWAQVSGRGFPGLGTLCSSCWEYQSAPTWLSTLVTLPH